MSIPSVARLAIVVRRWFAKASTVNARRFGLPASIGTWSPVLLPGDYREGPLLCDTTDCESSAMRAEKLQR
jgi:hypothetical protein